jgi:lipopolysaccharide/colanic/teichoic acid biosynthesis glycosyltransferase
MPKLPKSANRNSGVRAVAVSSIRHSGVRWAERFMALILFVFFMPLFLIISALVKLSGPGPVLFKQMRLGQNCKPIYLYKFRTMLTDATQSEIKQYAIMSDPRITPIGRFLRKTSMDELPQIFNIIRGELSFVGPRPALSFEVTKYTTEQMKRFSVPPGLTGLWQVTGRNPDFATMVDMDLAYVRTRSFWLDLKIIAMTVRVVITARGAY